MSSVWYSNSSHSLLLIIIELLNPHGCTTMNTIIFVYDFKYCLQFLLDSTSCTDVYTKFFHQIKEPYDFHKKFLKACRLGADHSIMH